LQAAGFDAAYPERRATHEFIITLRREAKDLGVNTMDFAKRLLDYGFHAPTTYFPLLIPECLLIEPTETESKDTIDLFIEACQAIAKEATENPDVLRKAPYHSKLKRLDETAAARKPCLAG